MGPDGRPLNVFKTLAHRPRLLRRVNALGGYFMAHGAIPVRERESVILRVAARAGSDYEIGQHRWIAAKAGLSAAEIDAAVDPASEQPFGEDEPRCSHWRTSWLQPTRSRTRCGSGSAAAGATTSGSSCWCWRASTGCSPASSTALASSSTTP